MIKRFTKLPPELKEQIAAPFLLMFGGRDKLDCWLTWVADQLANPNNLTLRPMRLNPAQFPMEFQSWMHRPNEVVDHLLERLEDLAIFGYTAKIVKQGETYLATVLDQARCHLLEVVEGSELEGLTQSLVDKYGYNLEVVKE